MAYIRYIPSAPLNTFINYLFYVDGMMPYPQETVFPVPSMNLKINFGGSLRVNEGDHRERSASFKEGWCVGVWNTNHTVAWPTDVQLFGVCFKPYGAYPFLQLPLSELHNQVVSLDVLWGAFVAEIRERLYAEPTIAARFALLEQQLLAHLGEAPRGLTLVQYAITQIARHHGNLSIPALGDYLGISQNHLIRQFKRIVGIPPKVLARLYRFEHVIRSIDPEQPVDWSLMAYQMHYYDQSHFNKDFVSFTGHNPTDYLRLRRRTQSRTPKYPLLLRCLPID